ncbi:MAG: S46 family peptidase [Bacteroidetes bacterium]|nr:S46 family peptidase [Bacteroidota bacterium]MBL6964708.1 S46 family peptidase [Bacteroidota bacterium]
MKKLFCLTLIAIFTFGLLHATPDEGMWLPLYIKKLNERKMQNLGMKLNAEDIYSINNASIKDAIVRLGEGFCTGEIVSEKGLVFTNHHCGFDAIASLSTVENDFLTKGFWAKSLKDEIPIPEFSVSRLVRMENLTTLINEKTSQVEDEYERTDIIDAIIDSAENAAIEGTHYESSVRTFYGQSEYYLMVYERFTDVRFVGAPPSSIGKFGGDTDNWMWPRHTGDFSILRIYMGADGKPAEYSENNIPYKPLHFLPISLDGVKRNDFAMIMGFPGTTERFLSSQDISFKMDLEQPTLIDIFGDMLQEMKVIMDANDQVRIELASDYASLSNTYKYFKGQNLGLKQYKLVEKYKTQEDLLLDWIHGDEARAAKYGSILSSLETAYNKYRRIMPGFYYLAAGVLRLDMMQYAAAFNNLNNQLIAGSTAEDVREDLDDLITGFNSMNDLSLFSKDRILLPIFTYKFYQSISDPMSFSIFAEIENQYKGDNFKQKLDAYFNDLFEKSVILDAEKLQKMAAKPSAKSLKKEKIFALYDALVAYYRENYMMTYMSVNNEINQLHDQYIPALREWKSDRVWYPDANSTLRMSYGSVLPYFPKDAVFYNYHTTHFGILEKEDPDDEEFRVDPKLHDLLVKKDFGRYGVGDTLYICFLTNNDITGGNSGSPVINAHGELIGLAFDGNWEAMTGDLVVDPQYNRTINVDIRYVLFVIDKFAGAKNLIDELKIADHKVEAVPQIELEIVE